MTINQLKEAYKGNRKVRYDGHNYYIQDLVFWIDHNNESWQCSPRLIDGRHIIQVRGEEVEYATNNT